MLIILVVAFLVLVGFLLYWFMDSWWWQCSGRGANSTASEFVSTTFYRLETVLDTGAKLWTLTVDGNYTGPKLLYLLGRTASVHHQTQYALASSFVKQGFRVYLLDYGSVCNSQIEPSAENWQRDMTSAHLYFQGSCRYIVARSLACPLLVQCILQGSIISSPFLSIAMITPVTEVDCFMLTRCTYRCCSQTCVAKLPSSSNIRCWIYYYTCDFFMHPICQAANVVYIALPEPPETCAWNIHCLGPLLQREWIASHFKEQQE